jgi:hypothetical protein
MMVEGLRQMLRGNCLQCKSEGNIITYLPIIPIHAKFENRPEFRVEMECQNCGAYARFDGTITATHFAPTVAEQEATE